MRVAVLLLAIFAVAYSNPAAETGLWRWKPRMPTVSPNIKGLPFPEVAKPPTKTVRVPGTWRAESCGTAPKVNPLIVNGQEAVPHSFPWQVGLFIDGGYFCGGSLISDEWVLTAAHCTTGASFIEVVLGAHDISANEPTQVIRLSDVIITHEDYGPLLLVNDVGLVHLSTPVTFTDEIQPVCLPSRSDADLSGGETVTASGWGKISDASDGISDTLNAVTMSVITNTECESVYGLTITSASICTDSTNGGTCSGDSGGPLNYVSGGVTCTRGVTSFVASDGCESGYPDGFTRTTHYLDWIETNTGIAID